MVRLVAAFVTVLSVMVALPIFAAAGDSRAGMPTAEALDDIPTSYLLLYQEAVTRRCPAVPWAVLAAIGKIESNHGRTGGAHLRGDGRVMPPIIGVALDGSAETQAIRDSDGGLFDGDSVYDRAVGPMQFIPTTWVTSGVDASGDGIADPHNAIDAIHAAAAYLCAAGGDQPVALRDAIFAYNHSWEYVDAVLTHASRYTAADVAYVTASPTLIAMTLANPRLVIYQQGRQDIADGLIDARILTVLRLASEHHTLRISSLKTGHSRCVGGGDYAGCSVSHHWRGRGADISVVDGRPVTAANDSARALILELADLPAPVRPDEVGSPWAVNLPGYFSDRAHRDHVHIAFDA